MVENNTDTNTEITYGTGIHTSYSIGSFQNDLLATILSMWVFKFYETEVFLPTWYITIAVIIYGVWNMVNDPFAGHISDLPMPLTKRWGKRFAWFFLTAFPSAIIFAFIFMPPLGMDSMLILIWVLLLMCLFDTLFSFLTINWQAIYPDKFRSQKERTKIGAIQIIMSLIGLVLGMVLPSLIITQGAPGTNIPSYVLMGWLIAIVFFVSIFMMIPGMRESDEMIDRILKLEKKKGESRNYLKKFKFAFKNKNFLSYLFAYLAQSVAMALLLASLPYWTQYVLEVDSYTIQLIYIGAFLIACLASIPLWLWVARNYGNRIGYMFGTGGSGLCLFLGIFVSDMIGVFIILLLTGFFMGATWSLIYACFSDVIDEIVSKTEKRDEGVYFGLRTFFGRLSIVIQALTFGILHTVTNFNPTAIQQTPEAQLGIVLGMFLVPALFYFNGFFFMWKIYDLKPEKVLNIKKQLIELKL